MLNFCTLFDKNYMSRGIAMYQSLKLHCPDFHLYIFAFDDQSDRAMRKMKLEKVTIVSLSDFEDAALLSVKPKRTRAEYCWTCTSSSILYCITTFNLQNCIYVDADLYFYQSPQILVSEKPEQDHVIITSHRYTSYYDQSKSSGKYCVQFMYFDNSEKAMTVLTWWRDRCIEWCYNRIEDGKFGDQKYLDDWTVRFDCVWELKNLGGGIAPWNVQQYRFESTKKGIEIATGNDFTPVFYHFHGIKFYEHGKIITAPNTYRISNAVKSLFYHPYLNELEKAKRQIAQVDDAFDPHGSLPAKSYFMDRYIKGRFSYFQRNIVKRIFN